MIIFNSFLTCIKSLLGVCISLTIVVILQSVKSSSALSYAEIQNALLCWVKYTQQFYFNLVASTHSGKLSKSLSLLSPFQDSVSLWRVGGRLQISSLSYSANCKHSTLLPKHSHLIHLIIDYYHKYFFHVGPAAFSMSLVSSSSLASRSVIHQSLTVKRCIIC